MRSSTIHCFFIHMSMGITRFMNYGCARPFTTPHGAASSAVALPCQPLFQHSWCMKIKTCTDVWLRVLNSNRLQRCMEPGQYIRSNCESIEGHDATFVTLIFIIYCINCPDVVRDFLSPSLITNITLARV